VGTETTGRDDVPQFGSGKVGQATTAAIHIMPRDIRFRTSRSSGPGGQNVNKLETRVELLFDLTNASSLTEEQKKMIRERLGARVNERGIVRIVVQESRSQWENKRRAVERLQALLEKALQPEKGRVATTVPPTVKKRRVEKKKKRGEVKRLRRVAFGE
jgi:ribosome-associated protein